MTEPTKDALHAETTMDQRVFWDDSGKCGKGGYFFRTPGLAPFIKKVEESTGKRVIALRFDLDEPNLIELVVEVDCSNENTGDTNGIV